MKSRDAALRAKRFDVSEKSRKAEDLVAMARDFETMALDLERQILAEEERTGVKDADHFSYSTFAKSVAQRRQKLLVSVTDLKAQLEVAMAAYVAAKNELDALEQSGARENEAMRGKIERNGVAFG